MSGRGKGKTGHAFLSDFIALGSKPGGSKVPTPPVSSVQTAGQGGQPKKVKGEQGGDSRARPTQGSGAWESITLDSVDLTELVEQVEGALGAGEVDRCESLVCTALKMVRQGGRARGEPLAWLSLLTLAKSQPLLFANSEHIRDALFSLLRRDRPDTFKSKVSRP